MLRTADQIIEDTADAEALERAVRVLKRRHDIARRSAPPRIYLAVRVLEAEAQKLRGECHAV